jgi:hypothetical protein
MGLHQFQATSDGPTYHLLPCLAHSGGLVRTEQGFHSMHGLLKHLVSCSRAREVQALVPEGRNLN